MMSASTVAQLRALAADPANRAVLVKDQFSLSGLVYFLDDTDNNVVKTALEALSDLSEPTANRPILKALPFATTGLEYVITSNKNRTIVNLAKDILHRITPASNSALKDHPNQTRHAARNKNGRYKKSIFSGSANKKAKIVTLQIRGLVDQQSKKVCEEQILKVRGVISFTFELIKHRCIIRTKADLKAELLIAGIAKSKILSAEQVIKNESGEEVLLSFGANPATADKENDSIPQYLPEDDSPLPGEEKAIARTGKQEQTQGWLGSAAKFLSQSFYW